VRSAGAIQIAPTPGIWWLQWSVHWPGRLLVLDERTEHSSGVELKRWKWSSSIFTIVVGLRLRASQSPQSKTPLQTTFEPASSCITSRS
jgi:hypothetical protein